MLRTMTAVAGCSFHDFSLIKVGAARARPRVCTSEQLNLTPRAVQRHQLVACGDNGAVFEARCTKKGVLRDRTFALKAVFNTGATNTEGAGFRQYEREFVVLSELPRHRNVMQFYTRFTRPVPPQWLDRLPKNVRDVLVKDRHSKKMRAKPLPCQWVVFEWLPKTVTAFLEGQSGGAAHPPWQLVVSAALDVGRALEHLWRHRVVRCVGHGAAVL